jgi:uncharacterized membrane protein YdbT with pleckstrin-like domain
MILNKLIGAGCILMGFLLVVWFPDTSEYQYQSMTWMFIIFGIFLIFFGVYLLKV